ncbi:MAG: c-type cytochrome [Chloroflexi bacterium]|nr:c-type cytochrome [Chloroflexota bacterium]
MKFRYLIVTLFVLLFSACNFSLAEDITPPPNYVPPTPMPTLGPLFPAEAPDIENGAAIYAEKCVECHGPAGMGDGDKGKQLPVTVAGLGLPNVGRVAKPSDWFTMVSRGNIERFMPPFISLTEQERWNVVAYALTLHSSAEQIERGKSVFETNCAGCSLDFFKNQSEMAALSDADLGLLLKNGSDNVTALSGDLSDDDLYAAAAYLRTLSFAAPTPTPEPASPTPTVAATEATPSAPTTPGVETGTPAVETTPLATETAVPVTPEAIVNKVTGSVSGENVAGMNVILHGFDHASDGTSGPQEIVTLETVSDADGNFIFENVEMPEGRIFYADAAYEGVTYNSDFATVTAGVTELSIPAFRIYPTTNDYSKLVFDQVHYFVEIADGAAQVIGVYTFSNASEATIVIDSPSEVPFIKFPAGAQNIGYERTQDSAPLFAAETGFAIPPSETPYGLVAFYSLPYENKLEIAQPFSQSALSVLLLVPEGMKVKSAQLTEGELQNFQGANYREFNGAPMQANDMLTFTLSGSPKTAGAESNAQQNILIGVGALGGVLILAGAWMYLRDRNRVVEEEEDEEEEEEAIESEEETLDAIIALDDLHRAGKINDEAYQTRREELKARLKN